MVVVLPCPPHLRGPRVLPALADDEADAVPDLQPSLLAADVGGAKHQLLLLGGRLCRPLGCRGLVGYDAAQGLLCTRYTVMHMHKHIDSCSTVHVCSMFACGTHMHTPLMTAWWALVNAHAKMLHGGAEGHRRGIWRSIIAGTSRKGCKRLCNQRDLSGCIAEAWMAHDEMQHRLDVRVRCGLLQGRLGGRDAGS